MNRKPTSKSQSLKNQSLGSQCCQTLAQEIEPAARPATEPKVVDSVAVTLKNAINNGSFEAVGALYAETARLIPVAMGSSGIVTGRDAIEKALRDAFHCPAHDRSEGHALPDDLSTTPRLEVTQVLIEGQRIAIQWRAALQEGLSPDCQVALASSGTEILAIGPHGLIETHWTSCSSWQAA